ncbi:MAG: RNA 2',3'-cyclic phosphodiesterase [Acidobacteria bacterium]|nr:RNA 2',3'-cyclic phosphodiesterase [Acidobacteriota bacterium]
MRKNRITTLPPRPISASLLRVFCAIELPAEVRARAAEYIARLREAVPDVRANWERTEKIHITLKFIGEIESERIEALSFAASRAAQAVRSFAIALEGTGAFPPSGSPRILWLGINDASGSLARLQSCLEVECASAGFAREERAFHPHLTLARIRAPQGARGLASLHGKADFAPIGFAVTDLVIMCSEPGQEGSHYTEISRHRSKTEVSE